MELWDICDSKGIPTGRVMEKGKDLGDGEYHVAVDHEHKGRISDPEEKQQMCPLSQCLVPDCRQDTGRRGRQRRVYQRSAGGDRACPGEGRTDSSGTY